MTDLRSLMSAGKLDTGFAGGNCRDELPHLGLIEATNQLPCIIVESQIEFNRVRGADRRALLQENVQILTEATLANIKDKIEAFFERVLKWIRSIIAKLKIQIQRIYMSGEELYEKYADKLGSHADYKDLTYNGYHFTRGSQTIYALRDNFDTDIEQLVRHGLQKAGVHSVILPRDFSNKMRKIAQKTPEGEKVDLNDVEDLVSDIDDITDLTKDERSAAMAMVLTGRTLPENWEEEIRRQAWGEKGEIRYGTDMFVPSVIGKILKDKALGEILDGYQKLEKSISGYRTTLKGEIAELYDRFVDETNVMNFPGNMSAHMITNRYYNAYISAVSDALSAATTLKSIKISFYTDMRRQAVAMLVRMVNSGNGPVNDSYDGSEDLDLF